MSRLKIQSTPGDGIMANRATVSLDGQELKSCKSVYLRLSVDDVFRAKVQVLATDDLDVEIDAHVTLNVAAYPGEFEIEETPLPNGGRRLRAVPLRSQQEPT